MKKLLFTTLAVSILLFYACKDQSTKEEQEDASRVLETITHPALSVFDSMEEDSVAAKNSTNILIDTSTTTSPKNGGKQSP